MVDDLHALEISVKGLKLIFTQVVDRVSETQLQMGEN